MPEPSDNIVRVATSDELASVIDRIVNHPAEQVFLTVPEDAYIGQNVLNFRLLQREAEDVKKNVVVVSDSERIRKLAVKASLKAKERKDVPEVSAPADTSSSESAPASQQESEPKKPDRKKFGKRKQQETEAAESETKDVAPAQEDKDTPSEADRGALVMDIVPPDHSGSAGRDVADLRNTRVSQNIPSAQPKEETAEPEQNREDGEREEVSDQTVQEAPTPSEEAEPSDVSEFKPESESTHAEPETDGLRPSMLRDRQESPPAEEQETLSEGIGKEPATSLLRRGASSIQWSGGVLGSIGARILKLFGPLGRVARQHPYYAVGIIGGAGVLIAGFIFVTTVLPRATITLYPTSVQDEITLSLLGDSNVSSADFSRGVVPAQVIEERKSNTFTFEATGTTQVEERATGTMRVFNKHSSEPQTLVSSTRFVAPDGKVFRTTETIVVPGAQVNNGEIQPSSTTVRVRADQPGEDYNIGPTEFSIPGFQGTDKYLDFWGETEEPMTGGFRGESPVITEDDFSSAQEQVEEEFSKEAEEALRNTVPDNLVLLDNSLDTEFETFESSESAGALVESFTIEATVVARAFLVSQKDLQNAIEHHFVNASKYNDDYELSDKRKITFSVREAAYQEGAVEFVATVNQIFHRTINTNGLVGDVRGKSETEVRRTLSQYEALERSQIRFWPLWVKTVPNDLNRVELNVQYTAELNE